MTTPQPVARAKPLAVFGAEQWEGLRRISSWKGLALVAHCWGVIALSLTAVALWPHPLMVILAVMIIGTRQLGLAILMHEAAHGLLHPDQRVNDRVGEWLCAAPVGATLKGYRDYHLAHHRYTQTDHDPDKDLSAPFPVTGASLRRKIIRDLTGQTFFKQRVGLVRMKWRQRDRGDGLIAAATTKLWPFALTNMALLVGLSVIGQGWLFAVWVLAMATWFPLATRLRNIAEHACVRSCADPFTHARTTKANLLERALIAPYWVNFHAEHHLFMYLPCYRMPKAHRILMKRDEARRMIVSPGYLATLRACLLPANKTAVS